MFKAILKGGVKDLLKIKKGALAQFLRPLVNATSIVNGYRPYIHYNKFKEIVKKEAL